MGAFESGQTLLQSVLDKLPEEQRAAAKKVFDAAEAKDAISLIGDSALARSDYSKHMDAIRAEKAQLTDDYNRLNGWWEVNKAALDDYKSRYAAGGGQPPPKEPPPQAEDPRSVAEQVVNEAGRDYIAASAFISTQAAKHYALFNEPLDAMEIVYNPRLGKPVPGQPGRVFSLQDAYLEKYGDRLQAKAKEMEDKRINDEVEKRLVEERKKLAPQGHPFPLRGDGPSVLDVLTTKEGPAAHTLDSAVLEYERLQQARGA